MYKRINLLQHSGNGIQDYLKPSCLKALWPLLLIRGGGKNI